MTSAERRLVREALIAAGVDTRTGCTSDHGDGKYQEFWKHRDGTTVTITWAGRDHDPKKEV